MPRRSTAKDLTSGEAMNEISRIYQAKPIELIERAPQKQPTSVLPVFGQNLRILTGFVGTQTKVAAELDIGRIQF